MNRFTLLTILITTLLLGCQKEYPIDESDSKVVHSGSHMNIEIAKSIFYQNHLSKSFDQSSFFAGYLDDDGDCFNFEPLWILANEMQTIENTEIVTVPLAMPNEYILDGRGAQLVFYGNSECTVPAELILYDSKDYDSTRPAPVNNCSFTGAIATYDFCSCTSKVFPIEQGAILAELDGEFDSFEQCSQSDSSSYRNDPPCYDFGSNFWENVGSFFSGIWSGIVNIFSSSGSSSSSGSGSSNGWSGFSGYSGFPFYLPSGNNTGTNYPSGGSTTNPQINTIFDGMFFNGEGQLVITLLEDLIAESELFICTEDLHTEMYHCLALEHEDFEPCHPPVHGSSNQQSNGQLSLDSYIRFLRSTPSVSNCLAAAISQHQTSNTDMVAGDGMLLCFIDENNNFNISNENLLGLFKTHCQQDEVCISKAFGCLGKLEAFQEFYNTSINSAILENTVFANTNDLCSTIDEEFAEGVKSEIFTLYQTEDALFNYILNANVDIASLNTEFATAPSWLWPIVREIGAEMIISIIEKQLKLNLGDDVKDLIRSIGQQDLIGFVKEAIDIVATFHPGVRTIDAIWETTKLGKKAISLIRKFKGMASSLGNEAMEKIWNAMNAMNANGKSVLENLDVTDWPKGIKFNNTSINEFWDNLVNSFGATVIPASNGVQFFTIGNLTVKISPNNTTGPSIIFELNGIEKYKIRF